MYFSTSVHSAYRERHSTETALLKVQSDILTALDLRIRDCVIDVGPVCGI